MSKRNDVSLFAANDYRTYVRAWASRRGRGEYRKIAHAIRMHTTLVSQVFSGRKTLTEEQASRLCAYMGLPALETDWLLTLVHLDRAGTEDLKRIYERRLTQFRKRASEARSRVPESKELTEQDRGIFYSSWQYSAVRLLTSNKDFQTAEKISARLDLPTSRVREILVFLVSRGLCRELPDGRCVRTQENTHVEATSPLAIRHHQNWRVKSVDLQERMVLDDLAFTAPVSISEKDAPKVRAILLDAISEIAKIVENSGTECVFYLGTDWIKM